MLITVTLADHDRGSQDIEIQSDATRLPISVRLGIECGYRAITVEGASTELLEECVEYATARGMRANNAAYSDVAALWLQVAEVLRGSMQHL